MGERHAPDPARPPPPAGEPTVPRHRRLRRERQTALVTGAAVTSTVQGALPVFLVGALAVEISRDLDGTAAALGVATTGFFVVAAAGSWPAGRLVDRFGARTALRLTGFLSAAGLLVVGVSARSWSGVIGGLLVAGAGNAFAQPGANVLIADRAPREHHGVLFGIKQAAVPAASLLAGVAVPVIGLTVGWRWAFVVAAVIAVTWPTVLLRRLSGPASTRDDPPSVSAGSLRLMLPVAVAGALGSAAQTAQAVFLVPAGVHAGMGQAFAGWLLALTGLVAITMRVVAGRLADRSSARRATRATAGMLVAAAVGGALLAVEGAPDAAFVAAGLLALGLGAGWNGLMTLAVVRAHGDRPALASGVMQTGFYSGGVVGPAAFGGLVEFHSYSAAWLMTAGAAACAAALSWYGQNRLGTPGRSLRGEGTDDEEER